MNILLLLSILIGGLAVCESAAAVTVAPMGPEVFESTAAAEAHARGLFAGGRVERLKVGDKEVLILYVYGSGRPHICLAAYRFTGGKWHRVAENADFGGGSYHAAVRDGAVLVVSESSGQEIVLLPADTK